MPSCHLYQLVAKNLPSESITEALKNSQDALAAAIYAWAVESGLGKGDGLSADWNQASPNYYSFQLTSETTSSTVDLVISRARDDLIVNARDETRPDISPSCTLNVAKYVDGTFFSKLDSEDIHDVYRSEDVTDELVKKLNRDILSVFQTKQHLVDQTPSPASSLQEPTNSARFPGQLGRPGPQQHPYSPQVGVPAPAPIPPFSVRDTQSPASRATPPGFEDEYEIFQRPHNGSRIGQQPHPSMGDGDRYPPELGRHPRLEPIIHPNREARPGMLMGPDDPIFGGARNLDDDQRGNFQRPPGARWDPTGPPGLGKRWDFP